MKSKSHIKLITATLVVVTAIILFRTVSPHLGINALKRPGFENMNQQSEVLHESGVAGQLTDKVNQVIHDSAESDSGIFSNSPVGKKMTEVLVTTGKIGPGLDEKLDALITELKKNPEIVLEESKNALKKLGQEHWEVKKKILFILGEVGDKSFLPLLTDIVTESLYVTDLPMEGQDHQQQNPEEIYYMRAILSIRQVATVDPVGVRKTLLDLVNGGLSPALTILAAQSYMSLGQDSKGDLEFLQSILPKKFHSLLK